MQVPVLFQSIPHNSSDRFNRLGSWLRTTRAQPSCHSHRTSSVQPLLKPHIFSFLFPFSGGHLLAARSEIIRPRHSHVAKPLCAIHCRPIDSAERLRFDRPIPRFISHPKSPSHPLCVPPSSLLFLCVNLLPFPLPLFRSSPLSPLSPLLRVISPTHPLCLTLKIVT